MSVGSSNDVLNLYRQHPAIGIKNFKLIEHHKESTEFDFARPGFVKVGYGAVAIPITVDDIADLYFFVGFHDTPLAI
jgi:hypothetical protein